MRDAPLRAAALGLLLLGCSPSGFEQGPPLAEPGPDAAIWRAAPSPFPLPPPRAAAPESAPTEPALESQPAGEASDLGPPTARTDGGLPPLPEWMDSPRLPRASAADPEAERTPPPGEGPLGRVEGVELSRADFNRRVQRTLDAFYGLTGSLPRSVWKQVVGGTFNDMVRRAVDQLRAKELGVTVPPEAIERGFQGYVEARGGAANFARVLRHMRVTEAQVREDVAAKLLHEAVLRAGVGEIRFGPEDVERWYAEHESDYLVSLRRHLRQIHIRTFEGYDAEHLAVAVMQARQALDEIQAGKPWEEVAKAHSEGATAKQGGELGWLQRGQMPKAFDATAFTMPCPSVSTVVHTELGFHVIECLEEKPGFQRPLDEELRRGILGLLTERERQRRQIDVRRRWFHEAKVEYLDPLVEREAKAMQARGKAEAEPPTEPRPQ